MPTWILPLLRLFLHFTGILAALQGFERIEDNFTECHTNVIELDSSLNPHGCRRIECQVAHFSDKGRLDYIAFR